MLHILCYFWIMLLIQESLHQWIGSLFHYSHVLFIICVDLYIPGGAGFQPQDLCSLNVFIGRGYTRIPRVVYLIQLCYRGKLWTDNLNVHSSQNAWRSNKNRVSKTFSEALFIFPNNDWNQHSTPTWVEPKRKMNELGLVPNACQF